MENIGDGNCRKVLVTGNKGYIGSVLCGRLLEEGFEVIGLDAGFYDGCNFFPPNYVIKKQIAKDIRHIVKEDLLGIDSIIHLAALSNDPMGALNPGLTYDINHLASLNLARLACDCKVERFVFSSSCSVYGVAGDEMINEKGRLSPATEYARTKVESEKEIAQLANNFFTPVFLRNATVYGVSPMLRVDLVVNNLAGWAYTTKKINIMSDGTPWRPLIHIQDICEAFIAVLKAPRKLIHAQVFNVGNNTENYRVSDIVAVIRKLMPRCSVQFTGEHGVDTRTYRVDFGKISRTLGDYFKPQWNIEKGIRELFETYQRANFKEKDFLSDKFTRIKTLKGLLNSNELDENLFWKREAQGERR